jgi:hypothetical protein
MFLFYEAAALTTELRRRRILRARYFRRFRLSPPVFRTAKVQLVRGDPLHRGQDVLVDVQGRLDLRVLEPLLDDFRVAVCQQQEGCVGVPEVVRRAAGHLTC